MSHQCVKCNEMFPDGSQELLKGCTKCGGKFFFYIRKDRIEQGEIVRHLTTQEKKQIEDDVYDIIGVKDDMPVILDLASINIKEPGKFELDLVKLFKGDPLVYRVEEGKYIIDVAETFKNTKKR